MFRKALALAAVLALTAAPALLHAAEVSLDAGKISGGTEAGVETWKGIPFAAPPVGPLRWRAPQAVTKWSGVRETTAYRNDCMQLPFPSDAAPLGTPPAEDCLYANVWRPAGTAKGAKLPVVFWIYGGGFVNGGSSPPTYSGAYLAKQGVVVVSFNYRLGRFGYFAHPQLSQAKADGPFLGNYGYMDQLAALHWVRRNVAAFGGDRNNVTIIGESAGGMSVHALLASPLAAGLFAKAVIMSGGDGGLDRPAGHLAGAEVVGVTFAQSKGIAPGDPQALEKLRALSGEQVIDGLNLAFRGQPGAPRTASGPMVDGYLAVDGGRALRDGEFPRIPIMIGATSADIGGKTGYMVAGGRKAAGVIAAQDAPVYAYRFSYVASSLNREGAGHASDIPFFFDTQAIKYGAATTDRDNRMGATIAKYVANFAKAGDPNGDGLPTWPRYDRASDEIMDFAADGEARPQKDPWGAEIDAAAAAAAATSK